MTRQVSRLSYAQQRRIEDTIRQLLINKEEIEGVCYIEYIDDWDDTKAAARVSAVHNLLVTPANVRYVREAMFGKLKKNELTELSRSATYRRLKDLADALEELSNRVEQIERALTDGELKMAPAGHIVWEKSEGAN